MCQYLYAAFSLKQTTDEGLTESQLGTVERWRKTLSYIATQEMLHLALVQNLLSAVGAAPHLERPNLPQPAGHYPPGVILTLLPFGEAALRHFMFLERPEGMDLADATGLEAVERAAPVMQDGDIVPRLQDFATVGHLYRSIEGHQAPMRQIRRAMAFCRACRGPSKREAFRLAHLGPGRRRRFRPAGDRHHSRAG
jgi:hypothetical protein